MSSYNNTQWLTQLAAYVASLQTGAITQAQFVTDMLPYTDGWLGLAYSDQTMAAMVQSAVNNFVARDANFDAWVNGTPSGGDGAGNYPLTTLSGSTITVPCIQKMLTEVQHGADAQTGLSFNCLGVWNPSELLDMQVVPGPLVIDTANITGYALASPTSGVTVTFQKNGVAWGTVTFAAGSHNSVTASFSSNTVARGDAITWYAPSSADATFLNFAVTLPGVIS